MKRILGVLAATVLLAACGTAAANSSHPATSAVQMHAAAGAVQPAAAGQMAVPNQGASAQTTRTVQAEHPAAPAAAAPASVEAPSNQATPAPCPASGLGLACHKP